MVDFSIFKSYESLYENFVEAVSFFFILSIKVDNDFKQEDTSKFFETEVAPYLTELMEAHLPFDIPHHEHERYRNMQNAFSDNLHKLSVVFD